MKYYQLVYLWHSGKLKDIKVSFERINNTIYVYIQDNAYTAFRPALAYLQSLASQVMDLTPEEYETYIKGEAI
jgi:hypothetical protein